MKYVWLLMIFLLSANLSWAQSEDVKANIYLGGKFGIPYGLGVNVGLITKNTQKFNFYVDASIQSIVFISTGNIGAGYVITRNGLALGLRYSSYSHSTEIFEESRGNILFPEINWYLKIGKKKQTLLDLQLGPVGLNASFSVMF